MKVTQGFQVADSRNLPKVDYIMLLEYMHENDCYNVAETRSAKALLASREAYVDTAVGYVEIKREGNSCTARCRVTPEHKIKGKLYLVTAIIDESAEKIIKVECNDCAASAGGCKHAICFAIWLIRRSDEPSVTSTTCYWSKPKLAGAISDKKVIEAKKIGKTKRMYDVAMNVSLPMFAEECKRRKMRSGMFLNYSGNRQPTLIDFTIFNLMLQFAHEIDDHTYNNFDTFCKKVITQDISNRIAKATKEQAESKLWHSMRQGRVTGSRIHEAIRCKTDGGALVQYILGGIKAPETKAIKRGKLLEKKVLKELESELGLVIKSTGFILVSPIIGVSPDGLCDDFVVEIKCPMSEKNMKNYIDNSVIKEKYKAQIMMQMYATQKAKGLFCIADPNFEQSKVIYKYWIDYDNSYVVNLLEAAEDFWRKFIFETILESAK